MNNMEKKLAIEGGEPAKKTPPPPMYPGGMLIDEQEEKAVLEVLRSKRLFRYYGPIEGPSKVEELEQAFAAFMGTKYAQAVTSGTAALLCGLQGIGIGPGDEVIVPAYTWIATASSVVALGGIPVLAEVDESLTLDPADVERKIGPYTKAIAPVHMRGTPCRMDAILEIARRHGLKVLEDTAQANGASYKGKHLGTWGDVGCFSLQFNKMITSGEGGMVITDDEQIWKRAVMFHDVIGGNRNKIPESEIIWGINFRMPELLGAVALAQLGKLEGLLSALRSRKKMILTGIQDTIQKKGIQLQAIPDPEGEAAVCLIFFTDNPDRTEKIAQALSAENIPAWQLYRPDVVDYHVYRHWSPIVNRRTWTADGGPWRWAKRPVDYSADACPRTLDLLGRAVHIDVNPLLTNTDVEETIDGINKVLSVLG